MNAIACPRCENLEHPPQSHFCAVCGHPLKLDSEPSLQGGQWVPGEHVFAVRLRPSLLKTWLDKSLIVDASQTGLLFHNGEFQQELTPGKNLFESIGDRIRSWITQDSVSAVLMRRGHYPLSLLGKALTQESDEVSFELEFGIQVGNRSDFYVNLMQTKDVVTISDLMRQFGKDARQSIAEIVQECSCEELLNPHPELLQRFTDSVMDKLAPIMQRYGLVLGYVASPNFSNQQIAEFQKERAQLQRALKKQELMQQFEADKEQIQLRGFQIGRALADAKVKAALEEAERTLEFDQLKAELKLRGDKHDLQLQETMESAIDAYQTRKREKAEAEEDAQGLRVHLLAVTQEQQKYELLELRHRYQVKLAEQNGELDALARQQKIQSAKDALVAELDRLDLTQIGKISRFSRHHEALRKHRIAEAEAATRVREIERDDQKKDFDEGLRQRRETHTQDTQENRDKQAQKLDELTGLSELQKKHLQGLQEVKRQEIENEILANQASHDMAEDAKDRESERQRVKNEQLNNSPELVQLGMLAERAAGNPALENAVGQALQMAMAKGMTRQQIREFMVGQSPEAAAVLKAKYEAEIAAKSQLDEVQSAALERIIGELKSAHELSRSQMQDYVDRMERMGVHTTQILAQVGIVASQGPGQPVMVASEQPSMQKEDIEALAKTIQGFAAGTKKGKKKGKKD